MKQEFKDKEVIAAIEWLKGEVTLTEYAKLTGVMQATSTYIKIARALREAYEVGFIKITKKN